MREIIEWCNDNVGFITAVLSATGLLLSSIAVIISLCTARLPYKKRLKLSSTSDVRFVLDNGVSHSYFYGYSISCSNVGNRDVCLTYLGIGIKQRCFPTRFIKLVNLKEEFKPTIIKPTEILSKHYDLISLAANLKSDDEQGNLFVLAYDSEEKIYYKKIDSLKNIVKNVKDGLERSKA